MTLKEILQKANVLFLRGKPLFQNLKIIHVTPDKVICEIKIEQEHLNINDRLFGGITASLVDIGGSLAIAAKTASLHTGVSTDMSLSFLKSAKLNDIVRIESFCSKVGKTLGFTRIELYVGNDLICTGSHTKFMGRGTKPNE